MSVIYKVQAVGVPLGTSTMPEGGVLALKLSSSDTLAMETMAKEIQTFETLQASTSAPPCPHLYDVIEVNGQLKGMVMAWCPIDMEQWWDRMLVLPDALEPLCRALSDVCRRIGEYHAFFASRGIRSVHADIKPRNIVLADDGRWLIVDFGAAKSRPIEQEAWDATRLILGTENFIAPEMLFNARKHHPEAMDTWSVALTFYTLLRMRRYRREGFDMPPDGTHNVSFRSYRMATVVDLRERRPSLFADRDLDPSEFHSPDRLPDEDRKQVSEALRSVFGKPDPAREKALEANVLALLDRALAIDPQKRFIRADDLSNAFHELVQAYWNLEGSVTPVALPPTPQPERASLAARTQEGGGCPPPPPPFGIPGPMANVYADFDAESRPTTVSFMGDSLNGPQPTPEAARPAAPIPTYQPPPPVPFPMPVAPAPAFPDLAPKSLPTAPTAVPTAPPAPPPTAPPPIAVTGPAPVTIPAAPPPQVLAPAPQTPAPKPPISQAPPPQVAAPPAKAPGAPAKAPAPPPTGAPPDPSAPPRPVVEREPRTPSPIEAARWQSLEARLGGIEQELRRPHPSPAAPGAPLWLFLAIGLLLFCQAIQFGLLIFIFLHVQGGAVSGSPVPAATTISQPVVPVEQAVVEPEAAAEPAVVEPESKTGEAAVADAPPRTPTKATPPVAKPVEEAVPAFGTISVEGARAYLLGTLGQVPIGQVAPGSYEVFAEPQAGAAYTSLGTVVLQAGQTVRYRCGLGSCKRLK